jgi:hypothetical protein
MIRFARETPINSSDLRLPCARPYGHTCPATQQRNKRIPRNETRAGKRWNINQSPREPFLLHIGICIGVPTPYDNNKLIYNVLRGRMRRVVRNLQIKSSWNLGIYTHILDLENVILIASVSILFGRGGNYNRSNMRSVTYAWNRIILARPDVTIYYYKFVARGYNTIIIVYTRYIIIYISNIILCNVFNMYLIHNTYL